MNLKMIANKKYVIPVVIILILLVISGILYSIYYFNHEKEISVYPINEIETVVDEIDGEEVNIEDLVDTSENTIEENVTEENTIEKNTKSSENNKTNSTNKNQTNTAPYYIKVNYGAQVVTIYKKDAQGNYTVPVKAMVCSTGKATPTSGVYSIPARWEWLRLMGHVYGHYSTQIKGDILFHSVPYLEKGNPASLEYWEYDKLGTYASAGCVRLTVQDAKWLFYNCGNGTKVEFYSSSNPGPLGKPSAKKISSYPDYLRNWDPTDPNPNNPWKTYKENTKTDTSSETNNKKDNTVKNNITQSNTTSNTIKDNTTQSNTTNNTIKNNTTQSNTTSNTIKNNTTQSNTTNNIVKNNITQNNTIDNTTKKPTSSDTQNKNVINKNETQK